MTKTLPLLLALVAVAAPARAEQTLRDVLVARLPSELPSGLGVVEVQAPPAAIDASSTIHIKWTVPPRAGATTFAVEIRGRRGERRTVWAAAHFAPLQSVVVARRPLVVGERLTSDAFAIEQRAVEVNTTLPIERAVDGATVRRAIAIGEPLRPSDVSAPQIARGTPVQVIVRGKNLVITTSGILDRAATRGERTAARLTTSQKLVWGRMTDATTFEIEGAVP